jgi:membrane associated rhomboid family serine protease
MTWRDAPATYGLAAVTLVVSVTLLLFGWLPEAALGGGFIPARVGADGVTAPVPLLPVLLTPVSTTLVHGGWLHLGFNLLMLVYAGRQAEQALGTAGLLVLYGVGAYASVAGQWLAAPDSTVPMIGASGAISAVVGAYALLFGERRARAVGPVPAGVVHVAWLAAGWIFIQLLIGATDGDQPVAIAAHIAGFLAGLALARPLLLWRWRGA